MNKIIKTFSLYNLVYGLIVLAVATVMIFAVLPMLPQVNSQNSDSASLVAPLASAYVSGGGGTGCGGCGESPGGNSYDSGYESPGGGTPTYTPPPSEPGYCPSGATRHFDSTALSNPGSASYYWAKAPNWAESIIRFNGSYIAWPASDLGTSYASGEYTYYRGDLKGYGSGPAGGYFAFYEVCAVKKETPPPTPAAKCESFTSNRTTVPHNGGNVVLTWDTTNATSVSINNGVGTVSADGSTTVYVNANTTFTLTATGTGGNDSCTVSITKENQTDSPRCDYFRVSDDEVEEGDYVTLSWGTTNASSVSINNGIGSVSNNGSKSVKIEDDITYSLTVSNSYGTANCTVRVEVEEEEEKKNTPKCELDISKDRVNKGDKVTLSWETKYVDEIVIKDDRGNTIFDTDDYSSSKRKKYFDGEIDVIINQSTEFRMTAYGEDGGKKTCKVDVDVDNDIAIYEKRDQALVIALTQVPYTGFEAGSFLTFLFYAVLTLWALFIAYILVIKKGSVLGFSLYGKNAGMSEADVANRKKVEALVAKYAGQNK